MPNFCAVVGCGSRGKRDHLRSFFRIPAVQSRGTDEFIRLTKERRQKWIAALKRADLTESKLKNQMICDKHFINGRPAHILDYQNPDWIPSKLMGYETENVSLKRRKRGKIPLEASTSTEVECILPSDDNDCIPSSSSPPSPEILEVEVDASFYDFPNQVNLSDEQCCIGTQTDLTMDRISYVFNQRTKDIEKLMKDIEKLKEKLNNHVVTEESFQDNKKTKFYTGLESFQSLMILFNLISKDLNSRSSLTKFQQLVLTLQRLKLNLSLTDLAYRYGISVGTASTVFQTCLYVLYKQTKRYVAWPEREVLRKTMPSVFLDTFGEKMPVIIDCLEIEMEKPSNLFASAQVWPNKQHHTTKFLVGLSPQGAITFISNEYDGRASDKELALNCGILEKLLPGDIVISDWGFLICDEGKKQLLPYQVEKNRKISDVRIHVEKVIGHLRQKYQILQSVLPRNGTDLPNPVLKTQTFEDAPSLINQIVNVCCALINICPIVVPLS